MKVIFGDFVLKKKRFFAKNLSQFSLLANFCPKKELVLICPNETKVDLFYFNDKPNLPSPPFLLKNKLLTIVEKEILTNLRCMYKSPVF